MKRDLDLLRSIMLYLEENLKPDSSMNAEEIPLIDRASEEEKLIFGEHINLLIEMGYLQGRVDKYLSDPTSYRINRVATDGYDFLDAIRDDTIWNKTKEKASNAGVYTLTLIRDIAIDYGKQALGL